MPRDTEFVQQQAPDWESPIDLRALDPDADAGAEARFVAAVMGRLESGPAASPIPVDPMWGVWSLARPLAVAGAAAAVVAVIVLARVYTTASDAPQTVAESIGVPPAFEVLMRSAGAGGRK